MEASSGNRGKLCPTTYAAFSPKPGGAVTGSCYWQGVALDRLRGGVVGTGDDPNIPWRPTVREDESRSNGDRVGGRDYGKDDFIQVALLIPAPRGDGA